MTLKKLRCSWSQVSILAQHFHIVNSRFPNVTENNDVYIDLSFVVNFDIEGLKLLFWSPVDDSDQTATPNIENDGVSNDFSGGDDLIPKGVTVKSNMYSRAETITLRSLSGFGTVSSLIVRRGNIKQNDKPPPPVLMNHMFKEDSVVPSVLQTHLWPELQYLELEVSHLNLNHILRLQETTPKLIYLKLYIPFENIPDIIWTFNWDSLPWRTGFVILYQPRMYCLENVKLDLSSKITSHKIPPVQFYDTGSRYYICFQNVKLDLDIDFSRNNLDFLGYFQFTFAQDFNIKLNLSHNNLMSVDLFNRYHVIKSVIYAKRDCDTVAKVRMLDLSFNQLYDSSHMGSDYCIFTHLNDLYFHHNRFNSLPGCSIYSKGKFHFYVIRDLKELRTLDLSHNMIDSEANFDQLSYDEFSTIREISFRNNSLNKAPDFVYQARYVTWADLSENRIEFKNMWPNQMKVKPSGLDQTTIILDSNVVNTMDLFAFSDLHNVLENFDLYLNHNPINCSCKSHRMYKYLISSAKSEISYQDTHNLPDFSFYKRQWKCLHPSQWVRIPMMKIPEYEYDHMCIESLANCSSNCFCYHSWKTGDIIIANCSHGNEPALTELPEVVPDGTSHLIVSNNAITSLCHAPSYISDLHILDFSSNALHEICQFVFRELNQLTHLDFSNNQLREVPADIILLKNLTRLDLSNNLLKVLPKSIDNIEYIEQIHISGNKFRCDCDTFWMTGWLIKHVAQVSNSRSIVCFSGQG